MVRMCFSEDEIQWGLITPRCHTAANVASRFVRRIHVLLADIQPNRHTSNEEANGIESRPTYDRASHNVNMRSPSLEKIESKSFPAWRRSSNSTQSLSVMEQAIRSQDLVWPAGISKQQCARKSAVSRGKWNSICSCQQHERRNASAIR